LIRGLGWALHFKRIPHRRDRVGADDLFKARRAAIISPLFEENPDLALRVHGRGVAQGAAAAPGASISADGYAARQPAAAPGRPGTAPGCGTGPRDVPPPSRQLSRSPPRQDCWLGRASLSILQISVWNSGSMTCIVDCKARLLWPKRRNNERLAKAPSIWQRPQAVERSLGDTQEQSAGLAPCSPQI